MVGKHGRVFGLDMTDELIELAKSKKQWHLKKFGYKSSNIHFRKGYIENIRGIVAANSIDLVTANSALNFSIF